jgi:ABC-type enterobactin transport system permease subunit
VVREARLAGFLILLAVIFVCAIAVGARLGPVTTSHSQVSYPGTGRANSGMDMGPSASHTPSAPASSRGTAQ